jgi:uncharacterized repeat protein (TIGR01451 family)
MIDTDNEIVELLMIPRIGRKKARALYLAGYTSIEDVASANLDDLIKVPGIWDELAVEIKEFAVTIVEAGSETPVDKLESDAALFICPACGSMIGTYADRCPGCDIVFTDEEVVGDELDIGPVDEVKAKDARDGYWYSREVPRLYLCPECGAMISSDATSCANCGAAFEGEEAAEEEGAPEPEKGKEDVDGYWYQKDSSLFICPNCGAFIPEDADACQTCGIVFEDEEEEPVPAPKEFPCPNCSTVIGADVEDCPECGFHFEKEKDGFWYKEQTTLFVCPNCGVFIPETADKCPQCGITFEGVEEEQARPEKPIEQELKEEFDQALYLCQACGAFVSESATSCSVCGADVSEEDEEKRSEDGAFQLPEVTQEISDEIRAEIDEIEAEVLVSPREIEGLPDLDKKPSIVKDFKKRWETIQLTDEEIEKELGLDLLTLPETPEEGRLEELDTALYVEPENVQLWEEKAKLLIDLDRKDEAIACLDLAAELNPDREMDYKKRILELLEVGIQEEEGDLSELVEIDEEGELKVDEKVLEDNIRRQIAEIDVRLEENPDDEALWQEKGELLEKLGEHENAIECFDESIRLSYTSLQEDAEILSLSLSLPEIAFGLTDGHGRVNGQVNGLLMQRGMINGVGKVNGLVNGLVNGGLINGLANDRVNGRVNGLINGGLVNGKVNGLINGGMINGRGLVNGEGLINGHGRFYGSRLIDMERRAWRYRVTWVVMLVALVLLVPMLANLLSPPGGHPIDIDGNFSDWSATTSFYDSSSDQVDNPGLNILETKSIYERDRLDVYVRTEGSALGGSPVPGRNDSVDSVFILIDVDSDANTGYLIDGIGADLMTEVYGWDNNLMSSTQYRFAGPGGQSDWNSFEKDRQAPCAVEGTELEVRTWVPVDMLAPGGLDPKILAVGVDSAGRSDAADAIMSSLPASLCAQVYSTGPDILLPGSQDLELLRLELSSRAGETSASGINFTLLGDIELRHVTNIRLFNDANNDNAFEPSVDAELGRIDSLASRNFTIQPSQPVVAGADSYSKLFLAADLDAGSQYRTVGFLVTDVIASDSLVSVRNLERKIHNIGLPADFSIDGAFGDWAGAEQNVDQTYDIISPDYNFTMVNRNIDMADARFGSNGRIFAYFSVSGVMMGGEDIPTIRLRPGPPRPPAPADTDRDTVPDADDPLPYDFDNDGVNDTLEIGDLDNDGIVDFDRGGTDNWLNTTIPSTGFPVNYTNVSVSIYIGPIAHEDNLGEDHVYVMIDSDDDPATGADTRGAVGADHIIVIVGKGNEIVSSSLYEWDAANAPTPWTYVEDVASAVDWYRMELEFDPTSLGMGLTDDFSIFITIEDWKGDYDIAGSGFHSSTMFSPPGSGSGTRSPAGDNVVFNEFALVPDSAEWIELANPTPNPIDLTGWSIQIQYRGWRTIYTFPVGSQIGAMGSGTEYIVVSDPFGGPWWLLGNQLRAGWAVRLRNGGYTVVDVTTLGNAAAGQTYARFKNETYGLPMDTDFDANDWYISNNGWIVPEGPTPGAFNTRKRPVFQVGKTGNTSFAAPGTQAHYTIYYNNTGDGRARNVWINDTIPAGMTFMRSSVAPTSFSGSTYTWNFYNVAPGPYSFTVTVLVNSTTPIGTVLTNNVNLDYTDQLSNQMAPSSDYWNVTVSGPVPQISVVKVANTGTASPGDQVTYVLYYNNTGTGNAGDVWINDTLPADLSFNSSVPAPNSTVGQTQYWHFANVAPGSYGVTLVVDVSPTAAPGSLVNTVSCDYTDQSGSPLPGSSDSTTITIIPSTDRIVMNEISVNGNDNEWVEVVNPTGSSVDISGWRIQVQYIAWFYYTVYTFPAGTVLGPWGSGSEYYLADTGGGNDFPNGGRTARLEWDSPGPGWTIVDQTTYPGGISNTQSWSRFKHEDTGVPVDTDNDANDWYISNDGWIVPEGPTPDAPNDRKRPVMVIEKIAIPDPVQPGYLITYTIWYNNTGDGNAKRVWVNDTLPFNVDFVSSSIAPTVLSGQDVRWYFNNIVHDTTNSITVTVQVNANASDGEVLVNAVDLIYHDALGRVMGTSTAWTNVTCVRPQITVEKTVDLANANAGDSLTYTIYFNNTGTGNAGHVWVNDTIPQNTTYQSSSVAYDSVNGNTYNWHFTNVAPGSHSFTITVQVDADAPSGTITNWAFLDYSTVANYVLESSSDSAITVIPEMQNLILAMLGIMVIAFIGLRKRKCENE